MTRINGIRRESVMKCSEIRELLSLYIDNMLDDNQVKEVEEHLSSCDACRKEYNELKGIHELLGQAEMIPVPDEFSFRLKKTLSEEKLKMIDEGLITKQPKKKNRWRLITSVAAIFAVGILSYGLYDNVMGNLPFPSDGTDLAGMKAATEETNNVKAAGLKGKTGESESKMEDPGSTSNGRVVMKEQGTEPQPMTTYKVNIAAADNAPTDSGSVQTNDAAAGSRQSEGDRPAATADVEVESIADTEGCFEYFALKNSMISQDECSRSLTGSGPERNSAAVQYYNKLIEEKLAGFDYQVLECTYAQAGEWHFRIFIFRGKDGNTYNEEIRIIGKDGKTETICSNGFMGL